jgi:hypothetical protein
MRIAPRRMGGLNHLAVCEVGNGARQLEDAGQFKTIGHTPARSYASPRNRLWSAWDLHRVAVKHRAGSRALPAASTRGITHVAVLAHAASTRSRTASLGSPKRSLVSLSWSTRGTSQWMSMRACSRTSGTGHHRARDAFLVTAPLYTTASSAMRVFAHVHSRSGSP